MSKQSKLEKGEFARMKTRGHKKRERERERDKKVKKKKKEKKNLDDWQEKMRNER